jgi:hypothetical protein
MSIVQTQTTSFKKQLYSAVHNLASDTLKIALYSASADLNADTTAYSATNEISGTGYTAGGQTITGVVISSTGTTAYVSFDNVNWTGASFTARCALVYNSSQGNKSIAVLDFGADKTTTSTFTIALPSNTATAALIRSAN